MLTHIQKSSQSLLDLLFPPRCVSCQGATKWLCQACLSRIIFIAPPICQYCGTPMASINSICRQCQKHQLQYLDGIRSAAVFEDNPIRPAIHALKYRNHQAINASLGTILAEAYRRYQLAVDVIAPVPLHPARLRERGYNQSELLARVMGTILDIPVSPQAIQRTRQTKSQMTLGIDERRQNVGGAFTCGSLNLSDQNVLLIDDVCTTGSTLDACAGALKQSGVASVWGLTLAKAS